MTPHELLEIVACAVSTAGLPHWPRPDGDGDVDAIVFVDDVTDPESPSWALVTVPYPVGSNMGVRAAMDQDRVEVDTGSAAHSIDADDCVFIDVDMARALIAEHLSDWLLARGWQVQVSVHRGLQHWRLADCLSFVEGGGDRLDDDYPHGDDQFAVLCESVSVVAESMVQVARRTVGPMH